MDLPIFSPQVYIIIDSVATNVKTACCIDVVRSRSVLVTNSYSVGFTCKPLAERVRGCSANWSVEFGVFKPHL